MPLLVLSVVSMQTAELVSELVSLVVVEENGALSGAD